MSGTSGKSANGYVTVDIESSVAERLVDALVKNDARIQRALKTQERVDAENAQLRTYTPTSSDAYARGHNELLAKLRGEDTKDK